jgi:nucleolar complex protein 3
LSVCARVVQVNRLRVEIGAMADAIVSDPERNVVQLDALHVHTSDADGLVSRLALLAECEVLTDIMPGYRIRLPTEQEQAVKHKKDVEKVLRFERTLLNAYSRFVKLLVDKRRAEIRAGKGVPRALRLSAAAQDEADGALSLPMVVAKCLCRLLEKGYDFNCRKDVITAAVPLLNHPIAAIRAAALSSVRHVFGSDPSGDATLESVRIVARLIKNKQGKGHAELLECFFALRLSHDILTARVKSGKEKAKEKGALRQGEKRRLDRAAEKELEKDLKEAEGEVSIEHRKRTQTAILTDVFATLFRIVKHHSRSTLLPTVLKALSRYGTGRDGMRRMGPTRYAVD